MKYCKTCGNEKDDSEFHRRAESRDGLSAKCKKCQSEYDKKRNSNPKRVLARKRYSLSDDGIEAARRAKKKYSDSAHGRLKSIEAKRRYRENNREKIRELGRKRYKENKGYYKKSTKEYRRRFPNKFRAMSMVNNAIRHGNLFKKPCEICGSETRIHGHHDNYLEPLNVRWLCSICHREWHKQNGEGLNGS